MRDICNDTLTSKEEIFKTVSLNFKSQIKRILSKEIEEIDHLTHCHYKCIPLKIKFYTLYSFDSEMSQAIYDF